MNRKPLRLHWDAVQGWLVDSPTALSDNQLKRICLWAVPKQIDRWRSLPAGTKKDELELAIKDLQKFKLRALIVDDQETAVFQSTQSTGKIFSIGGI